MMRRLLGALASIACVWGAVAEAAAPCPVATPVATTPQPGPPAYRGVEDALEALGGRGPVAAPDSERARQAMTALREGARHDDVYALNALGVIYAQGLLGQSQDIAAARGFYERALAQNTDVIRNGARMNLAVILFQSDDAAEQARALSLACAAYGDARFASAAVTLIAEGMLLGVGTEREPAGALPYLEQALKLDPPGDRAAWLLAVGYSNGAFGRRDESRASAYFKTAAEMGYGPANWEYGMALLNGRGVARDEREAFRWVSRGAEAGDNRAVISLAVMHALGQGTPVNPVEAEQLYRQAAGRGNAHAMRGLGGMLLFGESVRPDPALGIALLEMAARANDPMASRMLQAAGEQFLLPPRADIDRAAAQWLAANQLTVDRIYADE